MGPDLSASRLGQWFREVTGALQIAGGVLAIVRRTAAIGAGLIACTMAGAVLVDLFVLHLGPASIFPFVLLIFSAGVAWLAWLRRDDSTDGAS